MLLRAGGAVFFHGAQRLHTVAPIAELRETSNRCINVDPCPVPLGAKRSLI